MSNITLSAAVRSNLLSLQNTASLLDTTQTRLATGNKVNSALDNPTSYFTAASLNARASDLGNLLDSVSNAIQTIQAANDGITSITKLVEFRPVDGEPGSAARCDRLDDDRRDRGHSDCRCLHYG